MNANELADELENDYWDSRANKIMLESAKMLRQQQAKLEKSQELLREYTALHMKQQAEIAALNQRIERMTEKQSHYEAMAHAGGFEAGRELGMKQERALWELAASTQEIENERK
jgi:hypothetical protein